MKGDIRPVGNEGKSAVILGVCLLERPRTNGRPDSVHAGVTGHPPARVTQPEDHFTLTNRVRIRHRTESADRRALADGGGPRRQDILRQTIRHFHSRPRPSRSRFWGGATTGSAVSGVLLAVPEIRIAGEFLTRFHRGRKGRELLRRRPCTANQSQLPLQLVPQKGCSPSPLRDCFH